MEQMQIGAMRLVFRLTGARSLKDKRRISNKIRDRVRARFDVAVSEVESLDVHQRLVIGIAAVSNDGRLLESTLDKVCESIDQLYVAERVERAISVQPFDGEPSWR